jgi:hypothetical protein
MTSVPKPKADRPYMPGYGILPPDEGGGLLPWSWAEERLAKARNYWLITNRPGRAPHAQAVWGVWLDGRFFFSTGEQSRKAHNLAADPKCTVAVECEGLETVVLEGAASEERGKAPIARFVKAYEPKYDWKMDEIPGIVLGVRPRVVLGIGAEPFAGTATRWTFA